MNTAKIIRGTSIMLLSINTLAGCSTLSNHMNTERYLATFIGQSSQDIQKSINFATLGMSQNTQAIETSHALIYQIQRPMSIPIPMGHHVADGVGTTLSRQLGSSSEHYDVQLNCQIIFTLNQQNIAESVHYTGRAC